MGARLAGGVAALPYRLGRSALGAVWRTVGPLAQYALSTAFGGSSDDQPVPDRPAPTAGSDPPRRPVPPPPVPVRRRTREPAHDQRVTEDRRVSRERRRNLEQERVPDAAPAPGHVSDDVSLVASTADPETPLDAGPVLHVEEPWEGYATMPAKDIVSRLASATIAELAAVRLYEQENRARRSIIGAVERALDRRR